MTPAGIHNLLGSSYTPDADDDVYDVRSALLPIAAKWKDVGIALRLRPSDLDSIETSPHSTGPDKCLSEMLTHWLRNNFNVGRCTHTVPAGHGGPVLSTTSPVVPTASWSCQSGHSPAGTQLQWGSLRTSFPDRAICVLRGETGMRLDLGPNGMFWEWDCMLVIPRVTYLGSYVCYRTPSPPPSLPPPPSPPPHTH